jgi:3-oxoacyl-[acyl-carrier-protein] synthase-3
MTDAVYLDHIGFGLGSHRETVDECAAAGGLVSSAAALGEAGFAVHHRSPDGETAYDLARRAVTPIAEKLGDIGAVLYATCLPRNGSVGDERRYRETRDVKHLMEFPGSHLQADFGLDRAFVMGVSQQACTGLLGSLRLARSLLQSEPAIGRVLCLTADRFPAGALYEQSFNLISDGAAACVVSREPSGFRLLAAGGVTNGALARASDDETAGAFFSYSHRTIQQTLAAAELRASDVDLFVAQNMNRKALEILARLLGLDPARVVSPTIAEVAHMISGDNLVNLKWLADRDRHERGQRVLLFMAGYGLNWQAVVLERA